MVCKWELNMSRGDQPTRVVLVSDALYPPFDEGFKKFTVSLGKGLHSLENVELMVVSVNNQSKEVAGTVCVTMDPFFAGSSLRRALGNTNPDIVVYVPEASGTLMSFVRSRSLKTHFPNAVVALVCLQPRYRPGCEPGVLLRTIRPDVICVQSQPSREFFERFGLGVITMPSGVDLQRFRPVPDATRMQLRAKYGIDRDSFTVLHVGHLKPARGLSAFESMLDMQRTQVVVVGSTSTKQDRALAERLRRQGAIVIDWFIEHIEELYQLSDCFVFPVKSEGEAIEMPLSVLEAMACDLSVITTRFGALPLFFREQAGFRYVSGPEEIAAISMEIRNLRHHSTRSLVEPFSWRNVAEDLVHRLTAWQQTPTYRFPKSSALQA